MKRLSTEVSRLESISQRGNYLRYVGHLDLWKAHFELCPGLLSRQTFCPLWQEMTNPSILPITSCCCPMRWPLRSWSQINTTVMMIQDLWLARFWSQINTAVNNDDTGPGIGQITFSPHIKEYVFLFPQKQGWIFGQWAKQLHSTVSQTWEPIVMSDSDWHCCHGYNDITANHNAWHIWPMLETWMLQGKMVIYSTF